ncbi:hypothetical protein [Sphingobacterium litopenaei]|uniref:Uncharacterized protein n=1 Tax=Sphingobacterium litopenaei TaxID=2763500 RepID=A0ABR7YD54_9SPHI|nr:hypothetical protein [Sphingobacterium litopenaei]MBD1429227.1 hypothetical protein [Sphingobacterium litopenaei]
MTIKNKKYLQQLQEKVNLMKERISEMKLLALTNGTVFSEFDPTRCKENEIVFVMNRKETIMTREEVLNILQLN